MHPDLQKLQKRPTRRLKPLDPDQGPWLIWSHYHGAWHVQSSTGGCAGYTQDIAGAGVFGFNTATAYHDSGHTRPKWVRNRAIPVKVAIRAMEQRLRDMDIERDQFAAKINAFRRSA